MLRHRLQAEGLLQSVGVCSAGTHVTQPGQRPDPRVEAVLADAGCSLASTRASQVTKGDIERSHLILAMEKSQLHFLNGIRPAGCPGRALLVMDYAPGQEGIDVPDPYYGNRQSFERVYEMLSVAVDGLLKEVANNR